MKTLLYFILQFFLFGSLPLFSTERGSSEPYISGDSFRFSSDFVYDELNSNLDPLSVKKGNTIFVKVDYLPFFFSQIHPLIAAPYILITHNGDDGIPRSFAHYLDDPKLIAWFGQNVEKTGHPKLHSIPIGIANRCWSHGNLSHFKIAQRFIPRAKKEFLLYMNFSESTYLEERRYVANLFKNKPYCKVCPAKEMQSYLRDLAKSQFVLSPRGNGLDCHRTWEALLMGAIPIVKTSALDSMYEGLPVLIVSDWTEINEEFLVKKYKEITEKKLSTEKAYFSYWKNLIRSFKS